MSTVTSTPQTLKNLTEIVLSLDRRIRTFQLVRSLSIGAVVLLGALLLLGLLDSSHPLSPQMRVVLLAALVGLAVTGCIFAISRYQRNRLNDDDLIAIMEHGRPELREKILSIWELARDPAQQRTVTAVYIEQQLCEQLQPQLVHLRREQPLTRRKTFLGFGLLAVAVLIIVGLMMGSDGHFQQQASRLLRPWQEILGGPNAIEIVEPDRVVPNRTTVELLARLQTADDPEFLSETFRIVLSPDSPDEVEVEMVRDANDDFWSGVIPSLEESIAYRIQVGKLRSRLHEIKVVHPPQVVATQISVQPPAYTGIPPQSITDPRAPIEVFEGSVVELSLEVERPLNAGFLDLRIDDQKRLHSPLDISASGTRAVASLVVDDAGTVDLRTIEPEGPETVQSGIAQFNIRRDQPPEVSIVSPEQETRVRRDDIVPIRIVAHDDFQLGSMQLHLQLANADPLVLPIEEWEAVEDELRATVRLDLTQLPTDDLQSVGFRVRVADRRPTPGPQEAWSQEHRLIFDDAANAPGSQELARDHRQISALFERAKEQLADTVNQLQELTRPDAPDKDEAERQQAAERLAGEQVQTARNLQELQQRLLQHPLMQRVAQDVGTLNEQNVQAAADQLREWSETPEGNLQGTQQQVNEAAQQLSEAQQQFDRLAELERDLLELDRLAGQAGRLAQELGTTDSDPEQAGQQLNQSTRERFQQEVGQTQNGLDELVQKHDELRDRVQESLDSRTRELASEIEKLAQPELEAAQTLDRQLKEVQPQLDEFQEELRQAADRLSNDSSRAAQAARQNLEQAQQALQQGDLQQALAELGQSRQALQGQATPTDPQQQQRQQLAQAAGLLAEQLERQASKPDGEPDKGSRSELELSQLQQALKSLGDVASSLQAKPTSEGGETKPPAAGESSPPDRQTSETPDSKVRPSQDNEKSSENNEDGAIEDGLSSIAQRASAQLQEEQFQDAARSLREFERRLQDQSQTQSDQQPGTSNRPSPDQQDVAASENSPSTPDPATPSNESSNSNKQAVDQDLGAVQQRLQAFQNRPQPSQTSQQSAQQLRDALESQQELADRAARLRSDQADAEDAETSELSPQQLAALEAIAKQSQELLQQAARGDSGETEKTAESLQQQARALQAAPADNAAPRDARADALSQLAEDQARTADQVRQALEDLESDAELTDSAQSAIQDRTAAIRDELQRIGQQSQKLANSSGEKDSQPSPQDGNETSAPSPSDSPQQRAARANQAIGESRQEAAQSNLSRAAQRARDAAAALSPPTGDGQTESPTQPAQENSSESEIPRQVGSNLATAMDQMLKAMQQLAQSGSQQSQQAGSSEPGDQQSQQSNDFSELPQDLADLAEAMQRAMADADGQNDPQPQDSGSGEPDDAGDGSANPQPSSADGSQIPQLAENLQRAAQSMQAAAGQVQPNSSAQSGSQGGGDSAAGAPDSEFSSARLDDLLRQRAGRNWGQLPGTLSTEMLQAAPDQEQSDYAELIKQYFERIANLQAKESSDE